MNIFWKIWSVILITIVGALFTCGGNLMLAPWFGENPDSQMRLPWYDIWKYEIIVIFIGTTIFFFYIYDRLSQEKRVLYKKRFHLGIILIFIGLFISPILAGITQEYLLK